MGNKNMKYLKQKRQEYKRLHVRIPVPLMKEAISLFKGAPVSYNAMIVQLIAEGTSAVKIAMAGTPKAKKRRSA
jgi:hypothetical protein